MFGIKEMLLSTWELREQRNKFRIKNQEKYKIESKGVYPSSSINKKFCARWVSQMLCLSLKFDLCGSTTFQLLQILLLADLLSGWVVV